MKPSCLEPLLSTSTPSELATILRDFSPSLTTIQELKDYAAQFHFSQPAYAVQLARKTHELSMHINLHARALGCWCLGNALMHNSEYAAAKQYLTQARMTYLQSQEPLDAARVSVGLVAVTAYTGQPESALTLAAEIEPTLAEVTNLASQNLRTWAGLMLNCGVIHELLGDYEESISVYQRCIVLLRNSEHTHLFGRVIHNRAYALGKIGAFDEALADYSQAEEIFAHTNKAADLVRLYINRCHTLIALGRYQEAISNEEKIRQELNNKPGLEQVLPQLSVLRIQLYLFCGLPVTREMTAELHEAGKKFSESGSVIEVGLTQLLQGRCYLQIEKIGKGRRCYQNALKLVAEGGDRSLEFWAYHGLAGVADKEQDVTHAIELYEKAISCLEQLRDNLQIDTFRAAYLSSRLDVYRDLTALYLHKQRLADAFLVIERSKARLVMEKLVTRLPTEVSLATDSTDAKIRPLALQLKKELAVLEADYESIRFNQMVDDNHSLLQSSIIEKEQSVQALIREIQRKQPTFSMLTSGKIINLENLQTQLDDIIFLQYHIVGDKVGVFVVTKLGVTKHVMLSSLSDVTQAHVALTTTFLSVLGLMRQVGLKRMARRLPALLDAVNKHLAQLYSFLFLPLAPLLPQNCQLIICPDSFLHSVPFHALYDGHAYLIEHHIISYAPSATVIDFCRRQQPSEGSALLLGYDDNRLSAVDSELRFIADQLPKVTVKAGADATTDIFFQHAPTHSLIHIAAHAAFRYDKPMLSSISLADRRLTLAEICQLQLQADLITLSGCETGVGQIQGTDVLSLASAFLGAGTRSLLMSLWRVEDGATSQLIVEFYVAINRGLSYAEALREAQLILLERGKNSDDDHCILQHPVFWAPFLLMGKP